MLVKKLDLYQFRNYSELHIEFKDKINFVIGPNACGKTNLIEAIYYLCLTRSFKKAEDKDLIQFNKQIAQIRLQYQLEDEIVHELGVDITKKGKLVYFDNEKQKSVAKIVSKLLAIAYSPFSVNLFKLEPSERRKFMDQSISLISKDYLEQLLQFRKILKQRNMALVNQDEIVIELLTKDLIDISYPIFIARYNFVKKISKYLTEIYYVLFDTSEKLNLKYSTSLPNYEQEGEFKKAYKERFDTIKSEERKKQVTLIGLQKDDLIAYLDNKQVYSYCSQGQNRLVVLALHLSLYEVLYERYKTKPILLLDDVLSDLDEKRKERLIDYLSKLGQVFITTSDEIKNKEKYNVINVKDISKGGVN